MMLQCQASVEDCGSTLKQHWVDVTCLRKIYSRPSDGLGLGQRRRQLTGIEPAIGCDACPTLNRNSVGRPTSSRPYTRYTGDGGGRNTRYRYILTCLLGSFLNYILDI